MRIFLTGATGFVGGRIALRYLDDGHEVIAAVRTPSTELQRAGVTQVEGGLDAVDADALAGVDLVIHAAAGSGPDMQTARAVNRDGTAHIVAATIQAGVPRLVHISTTSVYDLEAAGEGVLDERAPLVGSEVAPGAPSSAGSPYAVTKAEAEREVAQAVDAGLSAAVLRPPAVLGAGPTSTWGTRVPQRIRDGEGLPIHPDSSFPWVHIEDLVDAVVAAGGTSAPIIANVIGGHVRFGDYLAAVVDLLPETTQAPAPPADALPWRGTHSRDAAATLLGIHLARSFESAMADIAESWRPEAPVQ